MHIRVRSKDFKLTPSIDGFAREQVHSALSRLDTDFIAVDVFLKDINGPRGGVDKQVLIRVRLPNRQVITVTATHESFYGAMGQSAKRIKRAVKRHIRKSRNFAKRRLADALLERRLAMATNLD
ncbi:MAG: HPF/RaiA family ribosome-associated protein [Pseudomonadota bacterium]